MPGRLRLAPRLGRVDSRRRAGVPTGWQIVSDFARRAATAKTPTNAMIRGRAPSASQARGSALTTLEPSLCWGGVGSTPSGARSPADAVPEDVEKLHYDCVTTLASAW